MAVIGWGTMKQVWASPVIIVLGTAATIGIIDTFFAGIGGREQAVDGGLSISLKGGCVKLSATWVAAGRTYSPQLGTREFAGEAGVAAENWGAAASSSFSTQYGNRPL